MSFLQFVINSSTHKTLEPCHKTWHRFCSACDMDKKQGHFPLIQHLWDTCVQNSHPAPDRKKITTTILSRQPILRIHALKIATCFYGLPSLKMTAGKSGYHRMEG